MNVRDAEWRRRILEYDPDGDAKDSGVERTFSDTVGIARHGGRCWICQGRIVPGEYIRREVAKVDGKMCTARACERCCDAMSVWPEVEIISERYELGRRRADRRRKKGTGPR